MWAHFAFCVSTSTFMASRSSDENVAVGRRGRQTLLAAAGDADQQFLRFLIVGDDLCVAHEGLRLLQELIVAPAAACP